jgi:phytoene dehydrogenase-like protein
MSNQKAVIIGGGIAGLCAGVYLRRVGFETEILEMHTMAGGLATAWKKNGFTFENCLHWLVGSKEGAQLNAAWKEIFDIGQLEFHNSPVFQVVERGGEKMAIHVDADKLRQELTAKAPEDAEVIREFTGLIKKFSRLKFPTGKSFLSDLAAYIRILPFLPAISKSSKLTIGDYARKFKNPLLRGFFESGMDELSLLAIVSSLGWMMSGNAGYPIGGSLKIMGLIEDSYKKLGGNIRFRAKVERIVVDNGRAAGVLLAGGEKIPADIVISAADGHATIYEMLDGKFLSDRIKKVYETYKLFPSYVQVSLGVAADLRDEPGYLLMLLDREVHIDPQTAKNSVSFRIFNFDPTFAPSGKTAVICFLATYNYEYWSSLREKDKAKYETEKKRVAEEVIAVFEKRFPRAKGKISVVDVATPATVIRYTGNWKGSMEGWLITPATGMKQLPAVLPGLKNFYMVGQWTSPGGGLPGGLMTARAVARLICRENRIPWKVN